MFEIVSPQTAPSLDIDWAPAYELIVSLIVFTDAKNQKETDLGPAWVRRTRQKLPQVFHDQLARVAAQLSKDDKRDKPSKHHLHGDLYFHLIRDCPVERDAASFVDWLESLTPGELYERVAPHWPESMPLPRDLGALRDQHAPLLRLWN